MNKIEEILINVAYDDLFKPNLSNLDIHPEWVNQTKKDLKKFLVWTQFEKYWGNKLHTFQTNTIDYFNLNKLQFIYPITLYSTDLFVKYNTVEFGETLLECIKNKKAKIVFFYTTEGDWGTNEFHFDWIDRLVDKYKFDNDDILVITTNLKAEDNYKNNKFKIISYNFFMDDLEFIDITKVDKHSIKKFENEYFKYISNNKLNKKTKHFLCFNGIPRLNRLLMFGTLQTNPKLKDTTIGSLRNANTNNPYVFYNEVIQNTTDSKLINFYRTYDATKNNSYDTTDWEKIYSWGNFINKQAHNNTFINIVTETMWNEESIFFTEKIYKSIYMCQPFILFGNPHSLKKLKQYGFKTFDMWWDESYDDELDLNIRLEKITKVLEEIASWDFDKCFEITNQMEEVLIHNYKQMMSTDELYKIYTLLQTDTKPTKKSII